MNRIQMIDYTVLLIGYLDLMICEHMNTGGVFWLFGDYKM